MNYAECKKSVPREIQDDALWNQEVYRLALFTAELAWHDVTRLFRDGCTIKLAAQLFDAVGSIGANVEIRNTQHAPPRNFSHLTLSYSSACKPTSSNPLKPSSTPSSASTRKSPKSSSATTGLSRMCFRVCSPAAMSSWTACRASARQSPSAR